MAVEAVITGANQWTPILTLTGKDFDVSLTGTFVATFTLQRSFDDAATWGDVVQYTAPAEQVAEGMAQRVLYRFGVKTGDFTSGSGRALLAMGIVP